MELTRLGENICRLRTEKRMSQEELAAALAVSRQSVSKWETGASVPDLDKLLRLSEIFGVTLDALVNGPVQTEETGPETGAAAGRAGPAAPARAGSRLAGNRRADTGDGKGAFPAAGHGRSGSGAVALFLLCRRLAGAGRMGRGAHGHGARPARRPGP